MSIYDSKKEVGDKICGYDVRGKTLFDPNICVDKYQISFKSGYNSMVKSSEMELIRVLASGTSPNP